MKRKDTKQHIISVASDLFYQNGYNLTGINEVIAEAGIAKATLYNHFKSKEDLCIAYLEERQQAFLNNLEQFCKSKPAGKARTVAILQFLLPVFENDDFNGCWSVRTLAEVPRGDERIKASIKQHKVVFLNFIKKLIQENQATLSPEAQERLAIRTYLLYETAVCESHLHGAVWPIEDSIALLEELCP